MPTYDVTIKVQVEGKDRRDAAGYSRGAIQEGRGSITAVDKAECLDDLHNWTDTAAEDSPNKVAFKQCSRCDRIEFEDGSTVPGYEVAQ